MSKYFNKLFNIQINLKKYIKNINIYFLNLFMKQRAEALEKQKY